MPTKKIKRKLGDIIKIPLGEKGHLYGHLTTSPNTIFYDGIFTSDQTIEEIVQLPELFTISVNDRTIETGEWPVVGHSPLTEAQLKIPYKYKQDKISGELAIYHTEFAATNYERPATLEGCKGLECAAVWDPSHVVDRILDHYDGKPNKWLISIAINESKIPK